MHCLVPHGMSARLAFPAHCVRKGHLGILQAISHPVHNPLCIIPEPLISVNLAARCRDIDERQDQEMDRFDHRRLQRSSATIMPTEVLEKTILDPSARFVFISRGREGVIGT